MLDGCAADLQARLCSFLIQLPLINPPRSDEASWFTALFVASGLGMGWLSLSLGAVHGPRLQHVLSGQTQRQCRMSGLALTSELDQTMVIHGDSR